MGMSGRNASLGDLSSLQRSIVDFPDKTTLLVSSERLGVGISRALALRACRLAEVGPVLAVSPRKILAGQLQRMIDEQPNPGSVTVATPWQLVRDHKIQTSGIV